jgi:hypothetical protein
MTDNAGVPETADADPTPFPSLAFDRLNLRMNRA